VTIVGAGGIGRALIPMLVPLGARVVAVNRSGRPVDGADRTVGVAELDTVLPGTDHVVVAAPSTPDSRHLIDGARLAALKPTSWLVNVARGELVDTDALVAALRDGVIAGAALDVTDPEPLPDGHPLWTEPRAIITPHSANPGPLSERALAERVADNIARRIAGAPLLGRVDLDAGY
jgi:phosphoglycerate dehydrogenase-like enzyme